MSKTGNPNYDAILERVAEIRAEERLSHPAAQQAPTVPANFSVDLGDVRMSVTFEPVGRGAQKVTA